MNTPRDTERAFRVLDGGLSDSGLSSADLSSTALADAQAAQAIWRKARINPEALDLDRLDRAVLRAAAEERIRRDESARVGRVLWPGLAFAGALAAAGVVWVTVFGSDNPISDPGMSGPTPVALAPSALGAGEVFGSSRESVTVRVGRAEIVADAGARCRVIEAAEPSTRIALDAGAAHFEVGKRVAGARFLVEAGDVTVTVVGTAFRVERMGALVDVAVDHGVVEVSRAGEVLATLRAGDHILVEPPTVAGLPSTLEASENPMAVIEPPATAAAEDAIAAVVPPPSEPEVPAAELAVTTADEAPTRAQRPGSRRMGRPAHAVAATKPSVEAAAPTVVAPIPTSPAAPPKTAVVEAVALPSVAQVALDVTEDDRTATAAIRELVKGLGEHNCAERVSDVRAWIADHPGHGRFRTAQHALAYCYHSLGRPADADRLFRSLGFKLKDVLDPKPPRM